MCRIRTYRSCTDHSFPIDVVTITLDYIIGRPRQATDITRMKADKNTHALVVGRRWCSMRTNTAEPFTSERPETCVNYELISRRGWFWLKTARTRVLLKREVDVEKRRGARMKWMRCIDREREKERNANQVKGRGGEDYSGERERRKKYAGRKRECVCGRMWCEWVQNERSRNAAISDWQLPWTMLMSINKHRKKHLLTDNLDRRCDP